MESSDIIDDINDLLKLGVGDPYRLEHIKQAYLQNKNLWDTDKKFLDRLKEKYLNKLASYAKPRIESSPETKPETKPEEQVIYCWRCGKESPIGASFCMICGSSLFDVSQKPRPQPQEIPAKTSSPSKPIGIKIPMMIGISVIVLAILGAGYSQGYFDGAFERSSNDVDDIKPKITTETSGETNSKCGKGTVFDPEINACVLA